MGTPMRNLEERERNVLGQSMRASRRLRRHTVRGRRLSSDVKESVDTELMTQTYLF